MAIGQPSTPQTGPQAAQPAPRGPDSARSTISADVTITGTIKTERDVQVEGRVEGDIRAAGLILGEKAFVKGDIYAQEAIIRGKVEGGIRARKVQLTGSAHVRGDIVHARQLSIESGADFEGSARHSDNPVEEQRKP
jgi:cytoskeletal protein CcmA (bactofilin family)